MNTSTRPVVILYGEPGEDAPADEQDTLVEVEAVARALKELGYRVKHLPLSLDLASGRWALSQARPLLVFNLVESLAGKGHYIHLAPTLLEEQGLAYTGSPLAAILLSSNKLYAKRVLVQAGLPTPPWHAGGAALEAGGPWLVKSVWEHASIGLDDRSLVKAPRRLAQVVADRQARYGGQWFAERYIDGREFNLALLESSSGWQVLPPAEILFQNYPKGKPHIVGYAAKWQSLSFEYQHTPRRFAFPAADQDLLAGLRDIALQAADAFQLRGYARVDVRVGGDGQAWILEVNANPCLSPDAGFVAAAKQAGLTFDAVIERIIAAALRATTPATAQAA